MSLLNRDLAFSFPDLRLLQERGIAAMEVAIETAQEQEACLEELRRCVREAPSRVDTRGMTRVLDQYQGTLVHPSYQETKELLKNRIDRLIDRVSEIESTCIREMKEYGEDITLLKWQYRTVMGMIGKGTVSLSIGEFKTQVEKLLLLGEEQEFRRYIEVCNGIILCQWDAIEKTARGSQISAEERAALLEVLRQLSQGEGAIQQHNYNTFVLLFAKSGKQEWLEEMYQEWGKTFAGKIPPSGYDFFREALSNADRMVLLYRITEIQNSSQSEEEKVERIAAYLKEYGEDQEMLYIEVIRQKEIAAWLNKNGVVGEQAAAELGRMQIEWDIEQRVQYLKTLTFDERLAARAVINGKTYSPIRPYHGEIPGYTYMEILWGADPSAVGGYLYGLKYVPNDQVATYKRINGIERHQELVSTLVEIGYFGVYLPHQQAKYAGNVNPSNSNNAKGAASTHKVVIDGKTYSVKPGPNVQSVQSSHRYMKDLLSGVVNDAIGNGFGGAIEGPGSKETFLLDAGNGKSCLGYINEDGVVEFAIEAGRDSSISGSEMFNRMMEHFGSNTKAVKGNWVYGDNLAMVNKLTAEGMSIEEAISYTWTGKQAAKHGFSNGVVQYFEGTPGNYTNIEALFTN